MALLDFKEIPEANTGTGDQDRFELFARDFLAFKGFRVLEGPSRGADGGRDLLVKETRKGVGGDSTLVWLVSCKHKAHSGRSVTLEEEANILDRVRSFKAQGFCGFYSTLPSGGLERRLLGLKEQIEFLVFDHEKIEGDLLRNPLGVEIGKRFFPNSLKNWEKTPLGPVGLFVDQNELRCDSCGKDLLLDPPTAIVVFCRTKTKGKKKYFFPSMYFSCKGHCDEKLRNIYLRSNSAGGEIVLDLWEDISDLLIPTIFLRWVLKGLNELAEGNVYSEEYHEKQKKLLTGIFPFVCRELSKEQRGRIKDLSALWSI